jgi:RimJ/RimL family protein N-acetyltransferase
MPVKALIRVDASVLIGSGPVMRCLVLARALRERGIQVQFASRELVGNLNDFLAGQGFGVHRLPAPSESFVPRSDLAHAARLAVGEQQDIDDTRAVLAELAGVDVLIVDHHALDASWQSALRPLTGRILVIDDLADRRHAADLLLDPNPVADAATRYDGLLPIHCGRLLGPYYTLDLSDARGAIRVVRLLLPPAIVLRPVRAGDSERMFHWRNHEEVRRYSHSTAPVERESHERWFRSMLAHPQWPLLIAGDAGQAVGVLRYDLNLAHAQVAIYLVPGYVGRGYGPAILRAGTDWLRQHHPEVKQIMAEVLPENAPSHRAFAEAGYLRERNGYVQRLASGVM